MTDIKLYSKDEVIKILKSLLYSSPSMVHLYPDGTVDSIIYEGFGGFDRWVEENLNKNI